MYVIRLIDLETTVNAMTEVSTTNKEEADLLLIKLREQFKLHVKARVQKSCKAKSLYLEVCIQELTHNRGNNYSLEPPEARPKVSWQS
jgi:hypothetical protein